MQEINSRPLVDILSEQTKKIVVMSGEKYVYLDTKTEVSESDFMNALQTLEKEISDIQATEYIRLRKAEYPPIEDYIDGIVKGDDAQVQEYIDKCLAIKAKYPKPTIG